MPELVIATAAGSILIRVDLAGREKLLIGRSETCDVRLRGAHVAGVHALLFQEQSRWRLLDLTLRADHGLWRGEMRIAMADLHEDDPIQIGEVFIWAYGLEPFEPRALPVPDSTMRMPILLREEYIEGLWRAGRLVPAPGGVGAIDDGRDPSEPEPRS